MPQDAPASKVSATQGYGAEIVRYDRYRENREQLARTLASKRGFVLIPPYDHPGVIAGQGTVAMEMLEEMSDLALLVVPLGGGGLLAGCAIAAKRPIPIVVWSASNRSAATTASRACAPAASFT